MYRLSYRDRVEIGIYFIDGNWGLVYIRLFIVVVFYGVGLESSFGSLGWCGYDILSVFTFVVRTRVRFSYNRREGSWLIYYNLVRYLWV